MYTKGRRQKKNGIMWEKFPSGRPPSSPPHFGKPLLSKKSWVYFSFQNLRNIFGLHQKITILAPEKTIALGIGDPPPSVGKVSHIFPFFFTTSGMQDWLGALKLRSSAQIDHISPPPYCKICFSTSESFWHAKNNLVNRHQEVGLGQTPPPQFGNFFHIIPVFF